MEEIDSGQTEPGVPRMISSTPSTLSRSILDRGGGSGPRGATRCCQSRPTGRARASRSAGPISRVSRSRFLDKGGPPPSPPSVGMW